MSSLKKIDTIDTPSQKGIPVFTFGEGKPDYSPYIPEEGTNVAHDDPSPVIHPGFDAETICTQRDWKGTFSGRAVVISMPDYRIVDMMDLACGLSGIVRYDGACLADWNVAIHSYLVALLYIHDCAKRDEEPDDALTLLLLMHDAHEHFTGDICTPVQFAFDKRLPGFRNMLKELQDEWDIEIRKRFGLPEPTDLQSKIIKHYDTLALYVEKHVMCAEQAAPWANDSVYGLLALEYECMFEAVGELADDDRYEHALTFLSMVFAISERSPAFVGIRDQAHAAIAMVQHVADDIKK
jgi:hypothetical protein